MTYEELPRAPMRKITVAFDIDGTLRSNKTETSQEPNKRIVELFKILNTFKNVETYVWSGGGKKYAEEYARKFGLDIPETRCISKFTPDFRPDIAIDDIQETNLGDINLIVREE